MSRDALAEGELVAISRRFRPALMAFFLRRLAGDHGRAEDLTQEVFVRLMTLPPTEIANSEAYIFQVASNLIRDQSRRHKIRRDYVQALSADDYGHVELRDPERIALARDNIGRVADILEGLPERTRTVFVLFRLEAIPRKVIAETFGISLSAVDKHLQRALAAVSTDDGDRA